MPALLLGALLAATIAGTVLGQLFTPLLGTVFAATLGSLVAALLTAALLGRQQHARLEELMQHLLDRFSGKNVSPMEVPASLAGNWRKLEARSDAINQMANGLAENGSRIAIAAAEVSFSADSLKAKVHEEVEEAGVIADTVNRISDTVEQVAGLAANAAASAEDARSASHEGQGAIKDAREQMQRTNEQARQTTTLISSLEDKSGQIRDVANVINDIAAQTNLLALNAAIEAARAGEQGRGFAVVADEVRNLASKTASATEEINETITAISSEISNAVATMDVLGSSVGESMERTNNVAAELDNILRHASNVEQQVTGIATGTDENHAAVDDIAQAVSTVSRHLVDTETHVEGVASQSLQLAEMAEYIHEALSDFELDTVHDNIRRLAAEAAESIGRLFEQAVRDGRLGMDDLFDRDYQPVPDTNPQKYSTRFDRFTDEVLPAIQEPLISNHAAVAYAGAVDENGYFPTHNKRYSQPLTGDYEKDLVNNRSKRIFSDRSGSRCGSHTRPFLLQTYKRDTGEVLHDLSVPIYVNGRHWGGFRIGYKAGD